jgi:Spy/CpxP family protein refolding chaperone
MNTDTTRLDDVSTSPARPSRRRWLALLAIPVALGALSLGAARAQGMGDAMHGGFRKERMEKLLTGAGATDAQKTQIQAVWQGLRPQIRPLRQQQASLRHQLGELIAAPTINQAQIEQLRKQSMQNADKISTLVTQGMMASAQVLTSAQRQTVLQLIEQHRHHGGGNGAAGAGDGE